MPAWTVGVTATGNDVGLSAEDLAALDPADRARRLASAEQTLRAAGADYVIESVAQLEPVLDEIARRLASGERP